MLVSRVWSLQTLRTMRNMPIHVSRQSSDPSFVFYFGLCSISGDQVVQVQGNAADPCQGSGITRWIPVKYVVCE